MESKERPGAESNERGSAAGKHPFLVALGERARKLRARRGLTRKALAERADVSERHLANLEYGLGNVSILILLQVAAALGCSLAELLGDETTRTPEALLLRGLLIDRDESTLHRVRLAVADLLGEAGQGRHGRIALIGLRGAGKSTLGRRLAAARDLPFIELSAEIERLAGCSVSEIHALYGQAAYRRHERHALEEILARHDQVVIATPGGLVSEPATLHLLLSHCTTVWLQADPVDHMERVRRQGDTRPMADNEAAMRDLEAILADRSPFYAKADLRIDTSRQSLDATFERLDTALAALPTR